MRIFWCFFFLSREVLADRYTMLHTFVFVLLVSSSVCLTVAQLVRCETTAGDFTVSMHREWAPIGYDRFMTLIEDKFFDNQLIYRTIPGFLVQFGVSSSFFHPLFSICTRVQVWTTGKLELI